MRHLKTAKLARWQVHAICWSGALLWVTGIAWLLLHNYGQRQGDFGPEANPLEPWMLRAHGAAMIAALVATGSLLVVHVWRGWGYHRQRILGITLLTVTVVLTLTGYCLYYVGDEGLRPWISIAHWAIGLAGLPLFMLHYRRMR